MRVYKLLFYPSNKTADIFYDKVSHILFQKDFVWIILKIILVNSVLLVVDLIIQQHMILDIMIAQLRINFRSDPLEEIIEISNCYIYTWDKTLYWYMTCAVILWKLYSGNPQKWTDIFEEKVLECLRLKLLAIVEIFYKVKKYLVSTGIKIFILRYLQN